VKNIFHNSYQFKISKLNLNQSSIPKKFTRPHKSNNPYIPTYTTITTNHSDKVL